MTAKPTITLARAKPQLGGASGVVLYNDIVIGIWRKSAPVGVAGKYWFRNSKGFPTDFPYRQHASKAELIAAIEKYVAAQQPQKKCEGCGRLPEPPDFYPCTIRNCDHLAALHYGTGDDRRWNR